MFITVDIVLLFDCKCMLRIFILMAFHMQIMEGDGGAPVGNIHDTQVDILVIVSGIVQSIDQLRMLVSMVITPIISQKQIILADGMDMS